MLRSYIAQATKLPQALRLHKSILFDETYYHNCYPDVGTGPLIAELHYLRHGMFEGRNPHPLFDTNYYLNQVNNFWRYGSDPITHFLNDGADQGINPHPLFDIRYYRSQRQQGSTENPLIEYLALGSACTVDPNPLFFSAHYHEQIGLPDSGITLLQHYLATACTDRATTFSREILEEVNIAQGFELYIERFSSFQSVLFISGWAFAPNKEIGEIAYQTADGTIRNVNWSRIASSDLVERYGPAAAHNRFELRLLQDLPENHLNVVLVFRFTDGSAAYGFDLSQFGLRERPHTFFLEEVFIPMMRNDRREANVLEIGSRDRSGFISKEVFVPPWMKYTGTDILPGENVDVVCDAHQLSNHFQAGQFDYIFSLNVFEHILMPWKVVLEINTLLKIGGKVMIFTHQTMPLHDTPCDYWRYSDTSWQGLFNADTGFVIRCSLMGDPVEVVARKAHVGSYGLPLAPAYLHSMVIAEKVGDSSLSWAFCTTGASLDYPTGRADL